MKCKRFTEESEWGREERRKFLGAKLRCPSLRFRVTCLQEDSHAGSRDDIDDIRMIEILAAYVPRAIVLDY